MSDTAITEAPGVQAESSAPETGRRNMVLNMGPQHPSTHGVLRLLMELDGETIAKCQPDIGFLHTGIEKEFEAKFYQQNVTLTDRVDYLAPLSNNLGYCLAVEKLLGLEIPPQAQWMRVMLTRVDAAQQPPGVAGYARHRYRRDVACSSIASASAKRFCASSRCSRGSG